ncbi:hypothetical protein ACFQE8_04190 [Salinirubellus sp. GCM10025818]|uniref:hypothetical protein n=1 Tax=Salinirubellus TaxID=2162630 RepID=UPI0030CC0183
MIDTKHTARAQQTVVAAVAVGFVLTAIVGVLAMGAGGMTSGIVPGVDSFGAGDTTMAENDGSAAAASADAGESATAPSTEAPSTESPPTETATTDVPDTEASPTETPSTETPETEATPTETPAAGSTSADAPATEAPETTLHFDSDSERVKSGRTATYDVVVASAHDGVGGAEMAIVVGDTDVATITEVRVMGSVEQDVNISENGSRADLNYTGGDTYDSGSFSIVEVTVEGQSNGETDLSIAPAAGNEEVLLFDEHGAGYNVTGTVGMSLTVGPGGGSASESTSEMALESSVAVQPAEQSVEAGETTTYEVVLENANGGVGAYGLTVSLDDASVGTITGVDLGGDPPSSFSDVSISSDGSSAEIDAVAADTADSGPVTVATVTVEGVAAGTTGLSVDVSSVGTESGFDYAITSVSGANLTVGTSDTSPPDSTDDPAAFQIDLVEGEPIQQLDPETGETYHKQDRFIVALQITEEENQSGGPGSPMTRTYQADGCEVTYSWLSFDNTTGESQVAVSVSDAGGCEGVTLSYVGYEFPDGTTSWDAEHADEQELKDSMTVTLQPDEEAVLTVDVSPEEPTAASISAPAGIGL